MKIILALAAAALGTTAVAAQTPATTKAAAAPATKPMAAPAAKPKAAPAAPAGKMATATTKSGKKITYDCSKKGNMNKKACKG